MVQNEEVRKEFARRLKMAIAQAGHAEWGAGARLAEVSGATAKAASKWLNAESMPGRANMLAIAEWLGVRVEWLQYGEGDPHQPATSPEPARAEQATKHPHKEGTVHAVDFRQPRLREFEIDIPQYDVRAAMGAGQVPPEYVEMVRHVVVDKRHLDLFGVSYSAPGNLAMITGWGQSMEPTINHGEPVIVDRGVDRFIGDGLYVFTWGDLIYLKRLQREPAAQIKVISDNRNHDPFYVPAGEVTIHARVVMVWNARKV